MIGHGQWCARPVGVLLYHRDVTAFPDEKNVAHHAVLRGASVRFVTAADLLLDLGGQETTRGLERRLRAYVKPRLLCVGWGI
jgi:IstB-like ATP binding protein